MHYKCNMSPVWVLQEASTLVSAIIKLEQEAASLRNITVDILNGKQALSEKFHSTNEKFQNVTHLENEPQTNTSSLRSEAKFLHNEVTTEINAVESRIKSLSDLYSII